MKIVFNDIMKIRNHEKILRQLKNFKEVCSCLFTPLVFILKSRHSFEI